MPEPLTSTVATEESLPSLVTRLVGETRDLATAEIGVVKARIGTTVSAYKSAALFFAIAGILALAALIALLVGAILALATLVGPGFATLIVVGLVLAISGVLAMIGKSRLSQPPRQEAA